MNILILGGYGSTGRLLTKHLLQQTKHKVIITGRHLEKAEALIREYASIRLTARQVDASDSRSLKTALQDIDFLLVAAPTTHQTEAVVRAAIEARTDYLDVQLSDEKLNILRAHENQIKRRQLCFVTEAGYHPGLPSAMVRYAASQVDCLESALTSGYLSVGKSVTYTEAVDELMECFLNYQAQVFKKGQWTKSGSYDVRKFDFGEGIGKRECYSMFFEELRDLPKVVPSLQEIGFYISGTGAVADALTMLVLIGLKVAPRRGLKPLGRLMWWSMTSLSRPPYRVVFQVEVRGQKRRRPVQFRTRIAHDDGYEMTAIPVVALLMQYEKVRRPGLHMMGHLAEPRRLFKDMQRMGVHIQTESMIQ